MDQIRSRLFTSIIMLSLFTSVAQAQNLAPEPFPLHWKPVKGAGAYLAEVQRPDGQLVVSRQVGADQTAVELGLIPGPYQLRLTTMNRLLTPESDTGWISIHVAAPTPPVAEAPPLLLYPGVPGSLVLSVSGMAEDAVVSLQSPSKKTVPSAFAFSADGHAVVEIPALTERGSWSLILTNPPKNTAVVSGILSVHFPLPEVASADRLPEEASDDSEPLSISGGGFTAQAVVRLVSAEGETMLTPTLRAPDSLTVALPAAPSPETYRLQVANASDETFVDAGTLTLTPHRPVIVSLTPETAEADAPLALTVTGRHFDSNDTVTLISSTGSFPTTTWTVARSSAQAGFAALPPGDYELRITAQDGKLASRAVRVQLPVPEIRSVTPLPVSTDDDTVKLNVSISRWTDGITAAFSLSGTRQPLNILDHTTNSLLLEYPIDLDGGDYDLVLANRDGGETLKTSVVQIPVVPEESKPLAQRTIVSTLSKAPGASLAHTAGLAVGSDGNLWISDTDSNQIRVLDPSSSDWSTLAGSGKRGNANGDAKSASFNRPTGLASDSKGNLFVADTGNGLVRKVDAKGRVTTFAQLPEKSQDPADVQAVAVSDDGTVYVADPVLNQIFTVSPTGQVSVLSGLKEGGYLDGPVKMASYLKPMGLALDPAGALYVADMGNNCIRKIGPDGKVTTFAGDGQPGDADGPPKEAQFNGPAGLSLDDGGTLWVVEDSGHRIRRVSPDGTVTTAAGADATGSRDGKGAWAKFQNLKTIVSYSEQQFYVSDVQNNAIRYIEVPRSSPVDFSTGPVVANWVGSGYALFKDGKPAAAGFHSPAQGAFDSKGNFYVADSGNDRVRRIALDGTVSTFVGPGASGVLNPRGVAVDSSDNVYVADTGHWLIRKVTPQGKVSTLAGTGKAVKVDGPKGSFLYPTVLWVDLFGTVYVADQNTIRTVNPNGTIATLAGNGSAGFTDGEGVQASFNSLGGLIGDGRGNLYVADSGNNRIRKISPNGEVTTLAGSGDAAAADGNGTAASFSGPQGLSWGLDGLLYVADSGNNRIRRMTRSGEVTTLAGSGNAGVEEGPADRASFSSPVSVAQSGDGWLAVVDQESSRLRQLFLPKTGRQSVSSARLLKLKGVDLRFPGAIVVSDAGDLTVTDRSRLVRVAMDGTAVPLAGGDNEGFRDGPSASAQFSRPSALALSGDLMVADPGNHRVRSFNSQGNVGTVVGGLNFAVGIAVSKDGTIFLADTASRKILKASGKGKPATAWVGSGNAQSADGQGTAASFVEPRALAIDDRGFLFVADGNRIREVSPDGRVATLAGTGWPGNANGLGTHSEFSFPVALAFDLEGNLLVADQGNNQIRRVTPEGVTSVVASGFLRLSGLAVDREGRIWATDSLAQAIKVISPPDLAPLPAVVDSIDDRGLGKTAVRRTIPMDGRIEQWAGIAPLLTSEGRSQWPKIPGSAPTALYLAVDNNYLYWMMTLRDGTPQIGDHHHYGLHIAGLWVQLNDWDGPFLPWVGREGSPSGLWSEPQPSDCFVGNGWLEVRFPMSIIRKYAQPGETSYVRAEVNRQGPGLSYQYGTSLGVSSVILY